MAWHGVVWCDVLWGLGQSALGHILQNWLTDVSIISWAECGRMISVAQTFGWARQTSKVPTACVWGAPFLNKGPIYTRVYLFFVSWIGRPIHQTKTKFDLVRLGPMWMWLVHWITYCSCFILLNQQLCRFGASCTRDSCMFSHPPKPSELKWVKTPSHIRYIHLFTINPICLLWSQWKVILLWWFVVVIRGLLHPRCCVSIWTFGFIWRALHMCDLIKLSQSVGSWYRLPFVQFKSSGVDCLFHPPREPVWFTI